MNAIEIDCTTGEVREVTIVPPAPVIPPSVTMRQARLALLGAGLLDGVEAAIAAMESPQREAVRIEWEYAATVERGNALMQSLGQALGMADDQIDQLFIAAAGL